MELETLRLPEPSDGQGPNFISFPFPMPSGEATTGQEARAMAFFSLRAAGDMAYHPGRLGPARRAFLSSKGLDPEKVLGAELHHTRRVLFLEPGRESLHGPVRTGEPEKAWDGFLVDPRLGAWVSVTVADCMPIWVLDTASGAYAVLHSGWKGTGILATAVAALAGAYGSKPAELSVILGPAIGACCYPVPPERARIFEAEFGPAAVVRTRDSERLDLRAANLAIAESLGIGALCSVEACTSCDDRLGSYRREGKDSFTRMLACCGPGPMGHARES